MRTLDLLTLSGAAVACLVSFLAFISTNGEISVPAVGGAAGQDNYSFEIFHEGITTGGNYLITTDSAAITYSVPTMEKSSIITFDSSTELNAQTFTIASTTINNIIPKGHMRTWLLDSQNTNASTTVTITAGAGVDIDGDSANDDIINGGVSAWLTCWNVDGLAAVDVDTRCYVVEGVDAG